MKSNANKKPKPKLNKLRFLWLLILIPLVGIILFGAFWGHWLNQYKKTVYISPEYVDDWSDLIGQQDIADFTAPSDVTIPSELDTIPPEPPSLNDVSINNDPIILRERINDNVENILIIGIDGTDVDNEGYRSDTMLIVSINRNDNSIKLVSVMRDIWVYFPNRNAWGKINAAYAYGGPGQTVNIINENFNLDIQKYVVLDFSGYKQIVDLIGGITLNITDAESSVINGIDQGGTHTLNGEQALTYARIRKIDSDFVRVRRQRTVLLTVLSQMRQLDPTRQYDMAFEAIQFMRSNISGSEITGNLFELALRIDDTSNQITVPFDGMYRVHSESVWYMSLDWPRQVEALHEYLYGDQS